MSLAVELRDVAFGYRPGQRVLEDVNLALGEGEFVAVAGPNGGGKTTLVRLSRARASELRRGAPLRRARAPLLASPRACYLAQRSEVGGDAPATVREVVSAGRLASGRLVGRLRREDRELVAEQSAGSG